MHALPSPNMMDVAAAALVAFAALRGYFRGLSGELAGLIGSAAALVGGILCYEPFGEWLHHHSRVTGRPAQALAFVAIVLGVLVIMILLRLTVGRVLRVVAEEGVNRPGGVIAGILSGLVAVVLVFLAVNLMPPADWNRRFGEESAVGTLMQRLMPRLEALSEPLDDIVPGRAEQ